MSQAERASEPLLVDTHAHLQDTELVSRIEEILSNARAAGVGRAIVIGTSVSDSLEAVELAARHPGLSAAVGVQPNHADEAVEGDWGRIVSLAGRSGVVALGETGLDRYWDRVPFDLQQVWFERHIRHSRETGLPLVIHCRDCEADIIAQLRPHAPVHGVLHSFTGTWDHAQAFLELGLHLSFAGMVTFTNKKLDGLRDAATRMPFDRLLVETDSPYLSPHPYRGKQNEPARVAVTAARLAELRGIPLSEFARQTTANAVRLFALPGALLASEPAPPSSHVSGRSE